ncbi:D-alanyl-D-alanine carboxypeptidase family protein [Kutzneria sp. CA-103260]|uniref:D-alanyl-D-alanine carboxypeptidase family protein n=1 Tax=Kutzneria sp. CA-103260 TaxID=2802641 RepID=UPI001BAC54FA|nr:serine hydrolase [Kutzneria sp. CA-103260]QUQ72174.1 D-alanyl-D-alanine carboxypeptidase [Kutzneria sp. CA-103260]
MPRRLLRLLVALFVLICTTGAPRAAADPAGCEFRSAPPPAVDASEKPAPGQQPPAPLPVPATPVGGSRMAECGPVIPTGAGKPPANQFESWVLADLDTGKVLAAQDPHARQRPASLIKVLLSLVAMRELKMDTVVTGTTDDANQDGTRVGIGPDGKYTNDQIFHALLMHSGNDCAHALATQLGGVEQTVAKMNALAKSLGALDTRTASPAGLDGPGMVSSAYDLAVLFRVAMQDKRFADAVGTQQLQFPGWGNKPGFIVANDNPLLYNYPGDLGGKTGYTDDALHTYINAAQRDGTRIVFVGMRGTMSPVTQMYAQSQPMMDYGFALKATGAQPVGQLVDADPTAVKPALTTTPAPPAQSQHVLASGQSEPGFSLTAALAVLALLVVLAAVIYIGIRRRRAS